MISIFEKITGTFNWVKTNIAIIIAAAVAGVFLYIIKLRDQVSDLKFWQAEQESEKKIDSDLKQAEQDDKAADDAETEYKRLKAEYLKENGDDRGL